MPAKSKDQQRAAAIALQVKEGDLPKSKLKGSSKQMYDSMSKKQLRDFAETKVENKPEKTASFSCPDYIKDRIFKE